MGARDRRLRRGLVSATSATAPPAAVLWDMDGTLVDTEPYWMAAEHELVTEFGGTWTEEDAHSIVGFDLIDAAAVLRERGGVALPPTEIVERLLASVIGRVREAVPWRPGARRLLSELRERRVPCALVTMSWESLARAVVDELPAGTFVTVVTGDMVTNGKPHPEPYQVAAERLGVDPIECVAIEDSPTGIASASAAGCVVVAVPNLLPIPDGPGRHVLPTLKGVTPEELGRLVAATPLPAAVAPRLAAPPRAGDAAARRRRLLVGAGAAVVALALVLGLVNLLGGDDDEGAARDPGPLELHTWAPYWALGDATPQVAARADLIHQLSPFWYEATGADSVGIDPNADTDDVEAFLDEARANDIPLVASIVDGTERGEMAAILADPATRATHVDRVVEFAAEGDWDGIDLDYEQFAFADGRDTWATTRPNWVAFVTELADRLHDDDRTLTVSIPPVYDAGRTDDSGYWVYDYEAIAPVVDAIRVMAYDFSVDGSDPGPIAPLDWVRRIVAGTSAAAGDPSKLILGIPLYGRNWPVSSTGDCPESAPGVEAVTIRGVDELVQRRSATPVADAVTGEWSFDYELELSEGGATCTQQRQVHYVDADGVRQRIDLAVEAGFGGVALFALGYDDDDVWAAVVAVNAQLAPPTTTNSG